jgi:hypothetical protein
VTECLCGCVMHASGRRKEIKMCKWNAKLNNILGFFFLVKGPAPDSKDAPQP